MAVLRVLRERIVSVAWITFVLAGVATAQVWTTGFESPEWPTANPGHNYSTPVTWSHAVTSGGIAILFDLHRFGLWGNQAMESQKTYFGRQAVRCRFPQSAAGIVGDSIMAARSVVDPRGVAFKLASTGLNAVTPDNREWKLELWTIARSGPNSGQAVFHKSWTSLRGDLDRSRYYVRESVAFTNLADGTYDIEWRLTQHSPTGAAFEMLMDDLEIYMGTAKVAPTPMPLSMLEPLIDGCPPLADIEHDHRQKRSWLMRDLDRHAVKYHADFYWPGNTRQRTPFTEFFKSRIRSVIDDVRTKTPAPDEILIWKLYSSGFVVKTPKYTFGLDVQEGPNVLGALSTSAAQIAMGMTDDDVDRLVDVLDFTLHTHYHHDHVNFDFARRMIDAGKRVFAPSGMNPGDPVDVREWYALYGNGIHAIQVAEIENPHDPGRETITLGGNLDLEVTTYKAVQSSSAMLSPTGPIPAPSPMDPINYSYHIVTDNGIRLILFGDVRQSITATPEVSAADPVLRWIEGLAASGKTVDIKLASGPLIYGPIWTQALIDAFRPLIRIHGHEWEMNHPSIGLYSRMWSDVPITDEVAFPQAVGECFRFRQFPQKPTVDPMTVTTTSATVTFTTTHALTATVRYGTAADLASGQYPFAVTEAGPARDHAITLTGLTPGETYYYRVIAQPKGIAYGENDSSLRFITATLPLRP